MKNLIVYVFLGALLASCAKKNEPVPAVPTCVMSSWNDSLGRPLILVKYLNGTDVIDAPDRYYSNGRLDSLVYSENIKYRFHYNLNGLIDTMQYLFANTSNDRYSFTYSGNDLIKIVREGLIYGNSDTTTYSEYRNGRPKYKSRSSSVVEYEYDENMNLVKEYNIPKVGSKYLAATYEYDKTANMEMVVNFYKQFVFQDLEYDDLNVSSRNFDKNLCISTVYYDHNHDITRSKTVSGLIKNNTGFVNSYKWIETDYDNNIPTTSVTNFMNVSYACE